MPSKVQAYAQMANHAATQITGSRKDWTDFLTTAARLYKYPYHEQLMIYVQRPNATACAEYDLWNNTMRRYVKRGSKGIALIDASGDKPRLRYVFDISDTGGRGNSLRPFLWQLEHDHESPVTAAIENTFGVTGAGGLAEQLQELAMQLADEYWMANQLDILRIVDDSFLEEYDDFNIGVQFRNAAAVSIAYTTMSRCGLDPDNFFEHEDFMSVFDFNTPETVAALGTAVSSLSQQVLRQIEVTIKNYERERSQNDERIDVQPERGLPDTRPDDFRTEPADRQVREAAEGLPETAPSEPLFQPSASGEAVPASVGDREDSTEPLGVDDAGADESRGRDRELESLRPDEVGGLDEQPESPSGGNDLRGADIQLKPIQLSLFPSEAEQIAQIDEAESEQPSAFSMPSKPRNPMWDDYQAVRLDHVDDIVMYQVGDFFEMFGADAETAAEALNISLTYRVLPDVGRVPMCGIPSHLLEQYVEKLREEHSVTISGFEQATGERRVYSLQALPHEAKQAVVDHEAGQDAPEIIQEHTARQHVLTEADIEAALQRWNGDIQSKRRTQRYMLDHSRDRDTAAWLSREYGGGETKSLFITMTDTDDVVELSWPKVQRRLAKLVKDDRFFTDEEHDNLDDIDTAYIREQLAASGIVNGELVDPDALDRNPFIQQVMRDAERIAQEEQAEQPPAAPTLPERPSFSVGDTVYLENGKPFIIEEIGLFNVRMSDPSLYYPIDRAESIESFNRLLARYPQPVKTQPEPVNFRITNEHLGEGGQKAKYALNVAAIRSLKAVETENRTATPDEQEILSRYVGWGGLPQVFDPDNAAWSTEYAELKELLTDKEYDMARASTLNAHYTSPVVIKAMYEAIENMGFTTGNVLEPAMGVGNFFGLLPESMAASKLYGVELDSITGRIATLLYPKANITVSGFETTDRKDFFDLAVGNVPFGSYKVSDRAFDKHNFFIHDYFFAKTIDQVRPGGVIAFITSKGTMDKQNPEVRRYIAERAELMGAVRLPNNAFKANAGTEVTTDIIFLQKRDRPIEVSDEWLHLSKTEDGIPINSYYAEHPEMVLGRMVYDSSMYGDEKETACLPIEGADLATQLSAALTNISGQYSEAELPELGEGEEIDTSIPADPDVRNFSYTIVDGEVYYRNNSRMVRPDLNATAIERVKGMVELRDCVQRLIGQQLDGFVSDAAIRRTQDELNELYDRFSSKYGLINSRGNALAFADDSSYYLLCSLEVLDDDGAFSRKADMFTKRTIKPHQAVDSVDTASEALALSISEKARVDMDYMASLTGKTPEVLADELTGVVFRSPTNDVWQTADEYLSGNVRQKLRDAEVAAQQNDAFKVNVEALQAAQPKDLDASEIEVRLGATWIDKEYIQEFMEELLEPPYYLRSEIQVDYAPFTGEWNITGKSRVGWNNVAAYTTYGTDRANGYRILEDTLNLRDVRIYDTVTDPDGKERRVLNSKETTLAQQKQQAIKDAFRDWIWRDPDRRQELVSKYNELFNSSRPREYDGRHIIFPGMNPEIRLREHQLNAVAHIIYGGNTLLAHEVGAGKTYEMVAAAMESKRLGLCHKSLFAVPNHLTEQWASEFLRLYPSANILVASRKDFESRNRKKFCARIATGDYDAVILGHSQFERIPVSRERQERLLQEQIWEIEDGLQELKNSRAERFTIKQLERTKKSLQARLEKLTNSDRKDDVVTFEQLGVDRLYVDEAHSFKNLFLYTKMRNVAGLSTTDAQKSSDMLLKCRYIDEMTDSKGVIFATGTPVSNSMTELYTMQRYLQHDTIRRQGLTHFDSWASIFGETTTAIELAPEGTGYRARTRFAKFFNLPELMTLFKEVADIKTSDQLQLPTPTAIYHNEVAQPTEIQKELVQELSERAAKVHSGSVEPNIDNMLKITSDGRKLGLDQRVINPNLPDEPTSKVNMCVDNVYRIWQDGQPDKLTQLLFCDLSTPKAPAAKSQAVAARAGDKTINGVELHALDNLIAEDTEPEQPFSIYDDIREKLVARGIPREQIAFIHEANTETRKKDLFAKVRSGQVRVLMGSTFKMGAGMNVQDRLVALHDLDCPWRPGDLEQRSGLIVRQGNRNKEVHIYRYVTEGTFDSYLWQTVENKQRFISQIMTSKSPVRSCEDIDETALSYAEIKALCAGDERIKEKMDLDIEVSKLRLLKANHQSQQYRLEDSILRHFPEAIERDKGFIAGLEADIKTLAEHQHPDNGFVGMTVRGDTLTDKDNAGAAVLEACKEVKRSEPLEIGSYRGFTMSLSLENFGRDYKLTLKGQMTHEVTLGKDARGNLTRIDNALASMPERLKTVQSHLENIHAQIAAAKSELGKPFPLEDELRVKSARLAELNAELNIDDRTPMERLAGETSAKSERPSVLDKLKTPCVSGSSEKKKTHEREER
jgi:N12 class adenine-specific DNA methylase